MNILIEKNLEYHTEKIIALAFILIFFVVWLNLRTIYLFFWTSSSFWRMTFIVFSSVFKESSMSIWRWPWTSTKLESEFVLFLFLSILSAPLMSCSRASTSGIWKSEQRALPNLLFFHSTGIMDGMLLSCALSNINVPESASIASKEVLVLQNRSKSSSSNQYISPHTWQETDYERI